MPTSRHNASLASRPPDGRDCQPHVVPVAFRYNSETDTVDVGGHGLAQRKKYRYPQTTSN